ncbi:MAG: HAD family hydrolase [Hydrococcus sp. Prado102]|jgi:HAD superfamily hydrolase (TIGR01509 family)|nr:HAD family hydrolase [Hydrococcus sp. Prado102]
MAQLKALIFDVDGTLADTERDGHRVAFNQAFAEAGLDWHWSEELYGDLLNVAGGKERIHFYLTKYRPDIEHIDNSIVANLHASKTEYYRQLLAGGSIPLRSGVKRLIQEARSQGIRLAIATTSALPNAIALLEHTLDPSWFEVIAAGDIVAAKKPAPDIYHYVLQKMDLDASECLVFEDSSHGLQASIQAGLPTVVTINDYTKNHDFTEATLVLDSLGEPEHPFIVISGNVGEKSYLDMELIYKYSRSK